LVPSSGCQEIPIRRYQTNNQQRPKSKHPVKSQSEYRDNPQWRKKAEAITTYLTTHKSYPLHHTYHAKPDPDLPFHPVHLLPQATTADPLSLSQRPNTAADTPYRICIVRKEKIDFDTGLPVPDRLRPVSQCQSQPMRN
jgi:hypothetical protein